jgi:WD40 repeat protein
MRESNKKIKRILLIIFLAGITISTIMLTIFFNLKSVSWKYQYNSNPDISMVSCAISDNGNYIAIGRDKDLLLFKSSDSKPIWTYQINDEIFSIDISADGQYLVVGSVNQNFYVFEKSNPNPLWTNYVGASISKLAISSDGNYIVISVSGTLYLVDIINKVSLWNYSISGSNFDISYDANLIVSAYNGVILVFKNLNSTPNWQYNSTSIIKKIVVSPNGEFFCTGDEDGRICFFNKTGNSPFQYYNIEWNDPHSNESYITSLSISEDGSYLVAGTTEGVHLYEKSSHMELWYYPYGDQVAISNSGERIIAGGKEYDKESNLEYLWYFNKENKNPIWQIRIEDSIKSLDYAFKADYTAVLTKYFLFLFNNRDPSIDEFYNFKMTIGFMLLGVSLGIGGIYGILSLIFLVRRGLKASKEEKEMLQIVDKLDEEFKEWKEKRKKQ